MIAPLLVLAVAATLLSPDEPVDIASVAARYSNECAAGAAGADCDLLRAQLEDRLFDDLVALTNARATIDRATLYVATRAESPLLAAYALALLDAGFGPADVPYVRAALDSPYPMVRSAAVELSKWFQTEGLRAPTQRAREALADAPSGSESSQLLPDAVPTAQALGAPLYPGARFSYLASSRRRPVFLSGDDAQKVTAFLAKGKKSYTAAEMTAELERRAAAEEAENEAEAEAPDPEEDPAAAMAYAMAQATKMMEAMNSGKDPMAAMQEMAEAKQAEFHDWTGEITDMEGVSAPRFVVLEEKQGVPTRVVAVYRDTLLDATAIAYLESPTSHRSGMEELARDPEAMMRWQRFQQVLNR